MQAAVQVDVRLKLKACELHLKYCKTERAIEGENGIITFDFEKVKVKYLQLACGQLDQRGIPGGGKGP